MVDASKIRIGYGEFRRYYDCWRRQGAAVIANLDGLDGWYLLTPSRDKPEVIEARRWVKSRKRIAKCALGPDFREVAAERIALFDTVAERLVPEQFR